MFTKYLLQFTYAMFSNLRKHGDVHSSNTNPTCSSKNAIIVYSHGVQTPRHQVKMTGRINGTNLIVTTMKLPCDTEKSMQVHFNKIFSHQTGTDLRLADRQN